MSSPTAISKRSQRIEERRGSPRETLKRYVVLVFFGEDNWGKLTNMSEGGMAFEFAKPPSLGERVNFVFQAMGCMPMPRNGRALGDSFEAPGEIVWTHEFERGAGVQFVDLDEASREQIRQWMSFEISTTPSDTPREHVTDEIEQTLAELLAPLAPASNTESVADKREPLIASDAQEPLATTAAKTEAAFPVSAVAKKTYEAPVRVDQEGVPESPAYSHPSVARLTFLVVSGCLAAFAVTAGVRIFMTRAAHRAETAVHVSDSAPESSSSTALVDVPSPVSPAVSSTAAPVTSSSAVSAPPFQVDVLDADGRSWVLWFVHSGSKGKDSQLPNGLAESSNFFPPAETTKRREATLPEKTEVAHTFTMVAPNVNHPLSDAAPAKSPAEVPAIQPEVTPSLGGAIGGALSSQVTPPAPPAVHAPVGGMVQQARLIRATLPVYPQLAKSSRVSGDVLVDALIDATGKVTTVKVISGPALLEQAAMETVRQWKYEPARLDGQAVAMHLTVTVKFHLD